jgi:hypothetical protein
MKQFFDHHAHDLDAIRGFPFEDPEAYAGFLAQTRHYVVHTTRLLGVTASRIGPEREKLHFRFMKHAAEERSHHLLAERDIVELHRDIADYPELPITTALYATQYFQVEHVEPTMIFGYIFALEGLAVLHGDWIYDRVSSTHGTAAATFVKLHANEDAGHMAKTFDAVARLTDREQDLIKKNFVDTCALYRVFLSTIVGTRKA